MTATSASPPPRSGVPTPRADRRARHPDVEAARRTRRRAGRGSAGACPRRPKPLQSCVATTAGLWRRWWPSDRIGSHVLLLNTSFAGPALAEVVEREGADAIVYDEEFAAIVDLALAGRPDTTRILGWTDTAAAARLTLERLIARTRAESRPVSARATIVLLTSGTTGTPKGARLRGQRRRRRPEGRARPHPVAGRGARCHRRADVPRLGLLSAALRRLLACTIVTRRNSIPQATLELVDRHQATGLACGSSDVRPDHGPARDVRNRHGGSHCGSPPLPGRACGPTW